MAFVDDHKELNYNRPAPQSQPNPTAMKTQEVPDIFNANWISEESSKASPGLAAVRSYLGSCQTMFGEANMRRSLPDVYQTAAANERDVETLVGKIEKRLFDGLAPTRRALADSKASIQSSIDSIGALKPDAYAAEIRAAFKAMNQEDAQTALSVAIDRNEVQTLSAVLDAPTLTTGLAPELRAALKNRYLIRLAPQQMQLLKEHEKGEQLLAKAELQILPTTTSLYEGTGKHKEAQEKLRQIKASYD
jgi:hypothetical protein